jgi:hypothetical protein
MNISQQFAPPFRLIAPFFIISMLIYAFSVALMFGFNPSLLHTNNLEVLGFVHLFLLGFMMMSIFGAMAQLVPVVLEVEHFAVYFVFVAGFNTLALLPQDIVDIINEIDTFLLTIAMTALGMGTKFSKFKSVGAKPFYAGGVMFVWLVVGGYFVTKMVVSP